MVAAMKPGSVLVDLAAESGGNIEGSVAGERRAVAVDRADSSTLIGARDIQSDLAPDASKLYAMNCANFAALIMKEGELVLDFDDELVAGSAVTHDGRIVERAGSAALLAAGGRARGGARLMDAFALITITILAVFLGFEVVSKVSSTLHTPLMSEANAIHGIILLGAIMVAGQAEDPLALALSILAVLLATINVVGGFVVTDRMLLMFSGESRRAAAEVAS